jgi:prefoldin subunit 5
MNPSVLIAINNLQKEKDKLEKEVEKLKRKLQFRHTTINDLRYSKKMLTKALLRNGVTQE